MQKRLLVGAIAALAALSPTALAADHLDGPGVMSEPSLDITDIFSWTDTSGTKLNLIMDVLPEASKTSSLFSDMGQYVLHVTSYASYPAPASGVKAADASQVICTFSGTAAPQTVSCWLVVNGKTADYATGNASAITGLTSVNGDFQVFTGPRQDPFYFNLAGFQNTLSVVSSAASSLTFNAAGCPMLDAATSMALVNDLSTAADGSPAVDFFAGLDVLSIVVQVKTAAVTSTGHTVVGVWGSTHI
jgi:hypothetical protein